MSDYFISICKFKTLFGTPKSSSHWPVRLSVECAAAGEFMLPVNFAPNVTACHVLCRDSCNTVGDLATALGDRGLLDNKKVVISKLNVRNWNKS